MEWLAIIVAAVVAYGIGALWYGPLFGKMWMQLTGMKKKDIEKNKDKMPMLYAGGFIVNLLVAIVLSQILLFLGPAWGIWQNGVILGFWAWLGFVATFSFSPVLWQDQPVKLWLLNNTHNLLVLLVMGGIIGGM